MAGSRNSNFNEKLTPYLQQKLVETSEKYGIQSEEYQAFEKQYLKCINWKANLSTVLIYFVLVLDNFEIMFVNNIRY